MENRVIKFRAWDKQNKWTLTPSSADWIDFTGQCWEPASRAYDTPNTEIERNGEVVLMQFTGLTDSNGVEIFEGDVIRTGRGDWGVIVWKAPFFEVTVSATESSLYSREWFATCEVIGNVYQNPELFEAK